MERCLELLSSKESKVRVEALTELCEVLVAGPQLDRALPDICKLVAASVADNNQKASAAACSAIIKVANVASVRTCRALLSKKGSCIPSLLI
jgi:hypothetical protein